MTGLEDQLIKLEKDIATAHRQNQDELEKATKANELEVQTLIQTSNANHQKTEEKCEALHPAFAEASDKLLELQHELLNEKIIKQEEYDTLQLKVRHDYAARLDLLVKGLEEKVKMLEGARDGLSKRNEELGEELIQTAQRHTAAVLKHAADNNALKQDISNAQKDQAGLLARYEKLESELAIAGSILEVEPRSF